MNPTTDRLKATLSNARRDGRAESSAFPNAAFAEPSTDRLFLTSVLGLIREPLLLVQGPNLRVLESANSARNILGCGDRDFAAQTLLDFLTAKGARPIARRIRRFVDSDRPEISLRASCCRQDGVELPVSLTLRRVNGADDLFVAALGTLVPASMPEPAPRTPALFDPLTGLSLRSTWEERLHSAHARAVGGPRVAVLFIDLDRFKCVNDTYGHLIGDHVLGVIAQRLLRAVRPEDLVARYGGDEFIVLLENVPSQNEVLQIARRICCTVRDPIQSGPRRIFVSASVGVKIADSSSESAAELIRAADEAMYRAKGQGRNSRVSGRWVLHEAESA